MWTLDEIRKFVCGYEHVLECPYCHKGKITFEPSLTVYPSWNDNGEKVASVDIGATKSSQSCVCVHVHRDLAKMKIAATGAFQVILANLQSAPRTEAEDAAHREEVLAGRAY